MATTIDTRAVPTIQVSVVSDFATKTTPTTVDTIMLLDKADTTDGAGGTHKQATIGSLAAAVTSSILPSITSANAGQSVVVNAAGTGYVVDSGARGFRNKVVNGGFDVWQRGTSFPLTAGAYCADRWRLWAGVGTASQVAGTNSQYALKMLRTAGSSAANTFYLEHPFETREIAPLRNKTVTLSFFAKCGANFSATGNLINVALPVGTGTEMANLGTAYTSQTLPIYVNITLTTTLQKFSITGSVPANSTQMSINVTASCTGTAGADDSFTIENVQLEEGSVATPPEQKPYQLEHYLSLRYYQQYLFATNFRIAIASSTSSARMQINNLAVLRANPTALLTGTLSANIPGLGGITFSGATVTAYTDSVIIDFTGGSSLTIGMPVTISGGLLTLSAEL
jgi:hypothetical protein